MDEATCCNFVSIRENALQSLGLQKGDRVALTMPNLLQYPVALLGTLRAGCVVVNCNPLYTPRELEYQLQDSGAKAIVSVENFAQTLEQVIGRTAVKHVVVTPMGEMLGFVKGALVNFVVRKVKKLVPPWRIPGAINFFQALVAGQSHGFTPVVLGHADIAFLQYAGGTTGVAKGAILTHANIGANVTQAHEWIKWVLRDGEEPIVTPLPLYHIFALTVSLTLLRMGARNLLIANPRDIPNFVKEWRKYPISVVTGVNTLLATREAHISEDYAQLLMQSSAASIVNTPYFTGVSGNSLRQSIVAAGLDPDKLPERDKSAMDFGNMAGIKAWRDILSAGQGVGDIDAILPVAELVARLRQECLAAKTSVCAG